MAGEDSRSFWDPDEIAGLTSKPYTLDKLREMLKIVV